MKTTKNTFKKEKLKFDKNTLLELNQNSLREVNGGGGETRPTSICSSELCTYVNKM